MKWSAGIVAVLLLAGCGGGGGSSDGGSGSGGGSGGGTDTGGGSEAQDLLALYQGVKEDVVLNESNQADYLKMLYSVDDSVQQSVSATAASRIRARLPLAYPAMALSRDARSQINESLDCSSGSGTVTGEINDNTGVGKLTYQFNDCYQDGLYISGKQIIEYQRWDLNNYIPLSYKVTNQALRYSSNSYYQELNGDIQIADQGLCTEVTAKNMLYSSSNKADEMYVENLVTKNSCDKLDISGAIYLAKLGRVSISTLDNYNLGDVYSKDTYKTYSLPVSGSLRLTGKKSSLTIASRIVKPDYSYWDENRTNISLDQDGDGKTDSSYDMPTWYLGVSTLVNYSDSDHDGMWDGWENFYGTNPKIDDDYLDSDSDGLSNYLEFVVGSSINNPSDNFVTLENTLHVSVEKPDFIYQNISFVMSISVSGTVSPWLKKYKVHDDLILDMSNLGDIDVTPGAGLPCIYNRNYKSLICKDIDLSQFASDTDKSLYLGDITIMPRTSWSSYLTASWSGHLQIASETIDLDISASDATYTMSGTTKAWGIEAINSDMVFPVNLSQHGDGTPSKIIIHGDWDSSNLNINHFEPLGYNKWNCDYSESGFTCEMIPDAFFTSQGGSLIFDKPSATGVHDITFTVTSYYGGLEKTTTSNSLLVVGHDTSAINQGILNAQQQGQLEYTIPDGIYVGVVHGGYVAGFTIKGSPDSQLWLYEPSSGSYLPPYSSYSIYADVLDGLTINAPAPASIYAGNSIRRCNIFIKSSSQISDGVIISPVVDGNKITISNYVNQLFSIKKDQRIQNNIIVNESNPYMALMDGEFMSDFRIAMYNNTLVGVAMIYPSWRFNVDLELKNNIFVAAYGSDEILPFNNDGSGRQLFTNNIFPVGYSAMGGNNLFTDNPGVDINHDYLLQADSPARDAGVAVDGLGDTDWQGLPRVVGAAPDIGASEYQIAP